MMFMLGTNSGSENVLRDHRSRHHLKKLQEILFYFHAW